ncbi:MAG: hypothetical protein HY714_03155 [Candidatus Omnitrophica bacterium]|nr:hypothetical protein [Candidatus Omnitrophota bacterium]
MRGNSELLDLQWAPRLFIGNAFARVPLESAWHRAQACPALGPNVSILDASDQANHLLYQAAGDHCKDYLFLYQLLDLAAVLEAGHLPADALAVEGAPPSSRKVLEDLRRAVDELFFRDAARREMSDPTRSLCAKLQSGPDAPEPQAFFFKIAGLPFLSPGEKFLMYLGYFIPDSKRLRQDFGEGWAGLLKGWIHHWTRFIKRALKVATGAFQ